MKIGKILVWLDLFEDRNVSSRSQRAAACLVLLVLIVASFFVLHASAAAQTRGWEKEWNQTLAAVKREGKVVLAAAPDPLLRQALPAGFTARFGIPVEYLAGRSSEMSARLRAERQAGQFTLDVVTAGIQTMATILYREKMLDPLKPILMLPEVTDPAKWKKGKLWFIDPEEKYILRLFNSASSLFHINTRFVKPEELKSVRDLLHPKWRGKISIFDPTVPGTGSNTAAQLYAQAGEDFVKALYIDQKPAISRDKRQMEDWLARGTYPISFGARGEEVEKLQKEGFPIAAAPRLPDAPESVSAASGLLALVNRAPHPNAAKLFLNWIASREGAELFSRAQLHATTRNDVDESFLPSHVVPRPGERYFDTYDWEFTVTMKEKVRLWLKDLMKG
jgi:iron(III) transport system substrate-binding protein